MFDRKRVQAVWKTLRLTTLSLAIGATAGHAQVARDQKVSESVQHIICSAYSATLAWQLAIVNNDMASTKMGDWAEAHAQTAIAVDRTIGGQAWATRDLINQLTIK
ncbi:MAG: hypothetical protein ABL908_20975, partial [Hyphomicrobium sp.]